MGLRPLVLATRNSGKVRELAEPLARAGFAVQLPEEHIPDVEETGCTFAENALLKARALAEATGLPALADDSGLEVEALNGDPGVHSARYGDDIPFAHPGESRDERNNRKLLAALAHTPFSRSARFCCCMALVYPAQEQADIVVHGYWEGEIGPDLRGTNGFGYDPLFVDRATGLSAAEISMDEKFQVSHRGNALRALLQALQIQ